MKNRDEETQEEFEEETELEDTEEEDFEDEASEDEESEAEDEESEAEEEESEAEEEESEATEIDSKQAHLVSKEKEKKASTPQDIPLNIVVEVGRLQMPIKTLMELKPGNLLNLNIHPESGVDLIVNGCRIGKGELLQIGETLGIRILELG